jgi:hypothetical protein
LRQAAVPTWIFAIDWIGPEGGTGLPAKRAVEIIQNGSEFLVVRHIGIHHLIRILVLQTITDRCHANITIGWTRAADE